MRKYTLALIILLGGINLSAIAQRSASESSREIQGMSPTAYSLPD